MILFRDYCGVVPFQNIEVPSIKTSVIYQRAKSFNIFLVDKRHDINAYDLRSNVVNVAQTGIFLSESQFLFTARKGARALMY